MLELKNIVRENIFNLLPYSSARDEFSGTDGIFLDANENPFGELNRYPDPQQQVLKEKLGRLKSVSSENIFIGNGSDEVIDLAYRIFCNPGIDKALTFTPTYGMYEVSARINNVELLNVPLTADFQIDFELTERILEDKSIRLIFICSPNNPTGNNIRNMDMLLEQFHGIVVVDEAYIDFACAESMLTVIDKYPNLIVLQTFSKAWGLAAARIGMAYADPAIISIFNKVKPPYNVSALNQKAAIEALDGFTEFEKRKAILTAQRELLEDLLPGIPVIRKVFPSDANFILAEVSNANEVYEALLNRKVIVRNRTGLVPNCIRITVGSPEENKQLINALKAISR